MQATIHHTYMSRALALALLGRYTVSPNPMVGCVIVRDGMIVGEGYHQVAGHEHAEVIALRHAGAAAKGATVYVNLEPCCHYGKTPPCTLALIKAGVKNVIIACQDPNPVVAGKGIALLQAAGIHVEMDILKNEALALNEIFFHYITHKRPYVIAKWAMSLDGKTVTHPLDDKKISCDASHKHVHHVRNRVDAVLIGKKTAINDNPLLTVRLSNEEIAKQPLRIILTSRGDIPLTLRTLKDVQFTKTLIATTDLIDSHVHQSLLNMGVDVLICKNTLDARVDLNHLLTLLGQRKITSLLVEGGESVHTSFFNLGLVNKVNVYIAPVFIGGLDKKISLRNTTLEYIDCDYYIKGESHYV